MLCLPRNLHVEVHKVLYLPRNLHMEVHKVLHLRRNLHMEVHKVLHLPRNAVCFNGTGGSEAGKSASARPSRVIRIILAPLGLEFSLVADFVAGTTL